MSRRNALAEGPSPAERVAKAVYSELVDRSGGPSSRRKRVTEAVADELAAVTRIRRSVTLRIARRAVAAAEALSLTTASEVSEEIAKVAMSYARAGTLNH